MEQTRKCETVDLCRPTVSVFSSSFNLTLVQALVVAIKQLLNSEGEEGTQTEVQQFFLALVL